MSSKITREVRFYNNAHYPLQSLAILHYYNKTEPKKDSTLYLYVSTPNEDDLPDKRTGTYEDINYEIHHLKDKYFTKYDFLSIDIDRYDFDAYDKDYWIVAWHNEHDKGFYYLTKEESLIDKIEKDLLKAVDSAIGDAIDICTESDAGTLLSKAGNCIIDALADADVDSRLIEKNYIDFKDDHPDYAVDIELRADRTTGRIQIEHKETDLTVRGYTYGDHKD